MTPEDFDALVADFTELRARLAAKDAEIADLTRRLVACVELPEIPILGQFVLRDNSEPKRVEFSVELFDDEGELTDFAFGPTPAAAIAALRQKMENQE